jgi:hypothetical protein
LQTVINQAASAMTLGVPAGQLVAAVDNVVALVGFDAPDENVAAAIRRLEHVTMEYRMWVLVTGRPGLYPAQQSSYAAADSMLE